MAAESWMLHDLIEVLGWTLLHFVWQGFAAVVLLATMLLILRRASAHARYLSACGIFSLMALAPLITSWWLSAQPHELGIKVSTNVCPIETEQNAVSDVAVLAGQEAGAGSTRFRNSPSNDQPLPERSVGEFRKIVDPTPVTITSKTLIERAAAFIEPRLDQIVAVWLLGVTVLSLRLFAGWLSVQRLRRRSSQPASESWQTLLRRLAERLRVTRPVKLVESALVEVPTVIGWLSPMILLPASAMTGLTTEQLEALLAHELAHVRRHDYLVNLLQTVVETLLFYHPAVWWISHRIRLEREHCCDDLAVQVCGDGLTYAKALVALEELRAPKLGLAMSSSGGSLLTRVARLIGETEQQRRPTGWFAVLLSSVSLVMAGALGAGFLTPPEKPTEGLPNDTKLTPTESTETNEETSGPTQRRGQETSAEREAVARHAESKNETANDKSLPFSPEDVVDRHVLSVVVEGNLADKTDAILKLVKIPLGVPTNGEAIVSATKAIFRTQRFYAVEPRYRVVENGIEIVFRVIERPSHAVTLTNGVRVEWHCRVRNDGVVREPSVDVCRRFLVILRQSRIGLGVLCRPWLRF